MRATTTKGQVYAHTTFNEDRTEAGEGGDYKIGVKETVERIYEPLETALQHAVGLKKIYVLVSQTTASASEMVINGLRGLDIEVNLIGQTTNGKNVGMEGVMRSFYNHEFLLYPVTFYVENAKGFRDYSTGFVPDVEIDDSAIYPGEFGTMEDQLGYIALVWIKSGKKPELQASSLTRGGGQSDEAFRRLVGYPSHTTDGRCRHASPDGRVVFRFLMLQRRPYRAPLLYLSRSVIFLLKRRPFSYGFRNFAQ